MISFAPWFYKSLLEENVIIQQPEICTVELLNSELVTEAFITLNKSLKPSWVAASSIYSNIDGSGTSQYRNVAVYKAISEALERWAFYEIADSTREKEFCFDLNPSTTGLAAYPGFTTAAARKNAMIEAIERWSLHQFWRGILPVLKHATSIQNLDHYEIISPFEKYHISLLSYRKDSQFLYAFAADDSLAKSFEHALIELARNTRVMNKFENEKKSYHDFDEISDKRLFYFSTLEGHTLFQEKIISAPRVLLIEPKLICDKELIGPWNKYTKVWRYLYADSFPDVENDHTFFMF